MRPNPKYFNNLRIKPKNLSKNRPCDYGGCNEHGEFQAKTKSTTKFFYCLNHIKEFNKNYNFFEGMSEEEIMDYQISAIIGHRPTWKSGTNPQANYFSKFAKNDGSAFDDPFDLFEKEKTSKYERQSKIKKGKIEGLRIAICGDIMHSRVARSNIYLLNMLGAEVRVIAPPTLMPKNIEILGVKAFTDMNKGLEGSDIVMMLRLQTERMQGSYVPSTREYYEFYGLDYKKITKAHPNALIMHPGPMNRGVEIDTTLADDINRSIIKEQVEMGVAVRMACLKIICGNKK